jgi:hypothetical protein
LRGNCSTLDKAVFRDFRGLERQGPVPFPQHGKRGRRILTRAASVFYDTGRSLALWVSAYEILVIQGRTPQQKQLATWVCRKVYDLRNDFLHGNDVVGTALLLNGKPVIDFAAILYRLMLTGFLDLHFNVPTPPPTSRKPSRSLSTSA